MEAWSPGRPARPSGALMRQTAENFISEQALRPQASKRVKKLLQLTRYVSADLRAGSRADPANVIHEESCSLRTVGSPPVMKASRGCCTAASERMSRPNNPAVSQIASTRTLRSQVGTASTW